MQVRIFEQGAQDGLLIRRWQVTQNDQARFEHRGSKAVHPLKRDAVIDFEARGSRTGALFKVKLWLGCEAVASFGGHIDLDVLGRGRQARKENDYSL